MLLEQQERELQEGAKGAAPKAPPDPKVGQMSEDAKAFGPAAYTVNALFRAKDFLRRTAGDWAAPHLSLCYCMEDGGTCPAPAIRDEARELLPTIAAALAGAEQSGNAEGAKALEIARAEGKAEGLEAAAEVADASEADMSFDEMSGSAQCAEIARRIRSLIRTAPGGSK